MEEEAKAVVVLTLALEVMSATSVVVVVVVEPMLITRLGLVVSELSKAWKTWTASSIEPLGGGPVLADVEEPAESTLGPVCLMGEIFGVVGCPRAV